MPDLVAFLFIHVKILHVFIVIQKRNRFIIMDFIQFKHAQPALKFLAGDLDAVLRPGLQRQPERFQTLADFPQLCLQRAPRQKELVGNRVEGQIAGCDDQPADNIVGAADNFTFGVVHRAETDLKLFADRIVHRMIQNLKQIALAFAGQNFNAAGLRQLAQLRHIIFHRAFADAGHRRQLPGLQRLIAVIQQIKH